MIITISGTPGSGKSSVGRAVAKKLGFKFYSAGDSRGKFAMRKGLTLNELNKKAESDSSSDLFVDNYLRDLAINGDNFVIDARLGFMFIPQSVKVFIDADAAIRAQRIFGEARPDESYKKLGDAKRSIKMRVKSDINRYMRLYSINPYELHHYDLVLDSSKSSVDELAGQIYRFSIFKDNPAKRI